MSENLTSQEVFTDRDPHIQGLIDQFLGCFGKSIHNGEKAAFKALSDDGDQIEFAIRTWRNSTEPAHVDLARRMRALRLVRYLSKPIFNPELHGESRKIELGTDNEAMWQVDKFCELYVHVEAANQGGEYHAFVQPEPVGPRSIGQQVIATFHNFDIHKKAIVIDGWQQVHSTYMAAPTEQREFIQSTGI